MDRSLKTARPGRSCYPVRQRLNGLLVRSARCAGNNVALFNPDLLSRVRERCYLSYRYRPGDPQVQVEREPGKRYLSIDPRFFERR